MYESSKASSPVVKYGAEMVESFASPIYDKFGPQQQSNTSNNVNFKKKKEKKKTKIAPTSVYFFCYYYYYLFTFQEF